MQYNYQHCPQYNSKWGQAVTCIKWFHNEADYDAADQPNPKDTNNH